MSLINYTKHNNLGLGTSLVTYGTNNPNNLGLGLRLFRKKLGKLLGRLANTAVSYVAAVVETALPVIGKPIADEVRSFGVELEKAILDLQALNAPVLSTTIASEPTLREMQIINTWFLKFKPFVEGLTNEVVAALKLTNKQATLTGLNAVLNKINAVQDHYAVTQETGLSQNAIDQRNALIYETLKVVHYTITEGLAGLKGTEGLKVVQVTFPMNQYNFQPLFSSSIVATVTGENYQIASTSTGGTKLPVTSNPGVINLPITTTKPDKIATDETNLPVVPVDTNSKVSTKNIIIGGALLAAIVGGVAYASGKGKKNKAARKK